MPATVLGNETGGLSMINGISAVTLGTHEMPRAVRFYRALGFEILHGDEESSFTSFRAGVNYLNLVAQPTTPHRDAEWGERFFHLTDPDGHELSFAWPLR